MPEAVSRTAGELTATTVEGIRWTYMGTAVSFLTQFLYTAVMSRLLIPTDFGLVALAGLFAAFVTHFSQLGTQTALIQKRDITTRDVRTAFTVSVILGCLFFGLFWMIAPLLAEVTRIGPLTEVVRGIAASFVLTGLGSTAIALLRRHYRFRVLALAEVAAFILGNLGIGVVAAVGGLGVWSLVLAWIGRAAILSVAALLLVRHSLRPLLGWQSVKDIYGFGSRVSVIGFLEFLSHNTDTFAVGRFFGAATLGQYSRATLMVGLPVQQAAANLVKVLLPGLSRIQSDTPRLRGAYLGGLTLLTGLLLPFWAILSVLAHQAVEIVLGSGWNLAARLIPLVGIAQVLEMITRVPSVMAEAMGILHRKLRIQLIHFGIILFLVSGVVALDYGVIALAAVWAVAEGIRFGLFLVMMRSQLSSSYAPVARILGEAVGLSLAVALAAKGATLSMSSLGASTLIQAAVGGLAALCAYGILLLGFSGLQIRQEISKRNLTKLFFSMRAA